MINRQILPDIKKVKYYWSSTPNATYGAFSLALIYKEDEEDAQEFEGPEIELNDYKAFEWLTVINGCLYINDTTMSYVLNLRLHQVLRLHSKFTSTANSGLFK